MTAESRRETGALPEAAQATSGTTAEGTVHGTADWASVPALALEAVGPQEWRSAKLPALVET